MDADMDAFFAVGEDETDVVSLPCVAARPPAAVEALVGEDLEEAGAPVEPPNPDVIAFANFQQLRWARGAVHAWRTRNDLSVYLLAGEAGCGKSTAIRRLLTMFQAVGKRRCVALTAATHAATDALGEGARTYHSAMGFDIGICRTDNLAAFVAAYEQRHGAVLNQWDAIAGDPARAASVCRLRHGCAQLTLKCPDCMTVVRGYVEGRACARLPPFFGRSLVVLDEYGMMTALDFHKVVWVLNRFALGGDQHYHLLLAGSVSQLSVGKTEADEGGAVWTSPLFRQLLTHSMALLVNHRQHTDVAYGRALSMMQFNVVTREAVDILDSRVIGAAGHDCRVLPSVVRIYNANDKKTNFNDSVVARHPGKPLQLPVTLVTADVPDVCSVKEFYNELRRSYPKVFSGRHVPEGFVVKAGTPVMLTQLGSPRVFGTIEEGDDALLLNRCDQGPAAPLRTVTFKHRGRAASFYPVTPTAAINTFCAQGATIAGGVVYCPPEVDYMMSQIKPSAYVAMSRVTHRKRLWLTVNPFAKTGTYRFFSDALLHYRKTVELGYE